MSANRMRRVNELLRRELGILCERDIMPRMTALVTITEVKTSPDLRHADVFVSVLGDEEQRAEAIRRMYRNRVRFQTELAHRVNLKYTPVLKFRHDRTAENADRVLSILDELDLPEEDAPETDVPDRTDP